MVNGSSASARTSYLIGQDSLHNGKANINYGGASFIPTVIQNVNIVGDAGDGQMHFVLSSISQIGYVSSAVANFRIGYVNMGSSSVGFYFASSVSGMEFDHNYFYKVPYSTTGNNDFFLGGTSGGSGWGDNKIHHNLVYLPRLVGYGMGDDGITLKSGLDIYNNTFIAYICSPAYFGGSAAAQHQDGFQLSWGSYNRIYNNTYVNLANSSVFLEAAFAGVSHCYVFNNVFCYSDANASTSTRAIDTAGASGYAYSDIIFANNLFIDYPSGTAFALRMGPTSSSSYSACVVANNVSINGGGYDTSGASVSSPNLSLGSASGLFTRYTALGGTNNDYHLLASASSLRGQGINLTSYGITTDRDGNTRPTSGSWDIGPYQYGAASTNPVIAVSPSQVATTYMTGTTNTVILQVQNAGAGTLAGVATVIGATNVYSITPGQSSYSLGAGTSQSVTVRCIAATTNDGAIIRFTGGGGVDVPITNHAQLPLGLSFAAGSGIITAPFALAGGYLSQAVATSATTGGQAVYSFTITNAGNYTVSASVNAPSTAANSLYVNIDAQPTDPTMIWDIPVTTGFVNQTVSWRGSGTDTNSQYTPAIFANLSAGTHQLIIVGREAGVQLGQITIAAYTGARPTPPSAPQNLRIVANP